MNHRWLGRDDHHVEGMNSYEQKQPHVPAAIPNHDRGNAPGSI
jgi:hypothetical protein